MAYLVSQIRDKALAKTKRAEVRRKRIYYEKLYRLME